MATLRSAWLLGSVRDLPTQSFTAGGAAASVAAGDYYLAGETAALSLCATLQASLIAAGVAGASVYLTRHRHVRITAPGAFAIVWGTATRLRDLLGFLGDQAAATSHAAPAISPLLWSPGKSTTYELAPRGVRGMERPLTYYAVSPSDGSTTSVSHGSRIFAKFSWLSVAVIERVLSSFGVAGEWATFFREVLAKGASFYLFEDVTEDTNLTTTAATLTGGRGPYVFTPERRTPAWAYKRSRGLDWVDRRADIELPAHIVPEYVT